MDSQSYADDIQLLVSTSPENSQSVIKSVEICISDIMSGLLVNKLKLNNDKTESLLLYSPFKSFPVLKPTEISVCGHQVSFLSSARNLGFYITDTMNAELYVKNICRSAFLELRQISSIRHFLSVGTTKTLVCALVLSRLDYCNSLLAGCPKYLLERWQKVQNLSCTTHTQGKKAGLCDTPSERSPLASHWGSHGVQTVYTLSFIFLWHSSWVFVSPSLCLHPV